MATTTAPCPAPAETYVRPTFAELYLAARKHLLPHRWRFFSVRSADAEDLVHDTVLVARRVLDRFRPRPGRDPDRALASFLFAIAWYLAARHGQRLSLREALPHTPADPEPDPEAQASAAERRRLLVQLLSAIQAERADALILHEGRGLSAPEVARTLGIRENTAKSRIHRGLHEARQVARRLPPSERLLLQGACG